MKHLTYFEKLPEKAFIKNTLHCRGDLILVTRGEMGYNPIFTKATAEELNARRGYSVTYAQASAMLNGSMFGWDTPSADPDNEINQEPPHV